MPKFFVDEIAAHSVILTGETASHISRSLRMKVGEEVVLCDGKGTDYGCIIEKITKTEVHLSVAFKTPSETEPEIKISVYQGLPKGDKMAEVVKKCTEIGAHDFHPVIMKRSIMKVDEKSAGRKLARLRKIAAEAASQSRRGIIPEVFEFERYENALEKCKSERIILFYENGGEKLNSVLKEFKKQNVKSIAVIIGAEGGIEESEVEFAKQKGAVVASLGKRILRTQTAPVCAVSNILYELE